MQALPTPGYVQLQCNAHFREQEGGRRLLRGRAARGAGRVHTACSPPSLCIHVTSSAGLEGAQGASAVFSTIPRLPDEFAGLCFDSSKRIAYPFPVSRPSRAGAWKLTAFERPGGALAETQAW